MSWGATVWLSGLHCSLPALKDWAPLPAQWPYLSVLLNFPLDCVDFTQCMLGQTPTSCNPEEEYAGKEHAW